MATVAKDIRAAEWLTVDRYTDIVGPGVDMLGPVCDGGRVEYLTVPGCWGPMITPGLRSGHEVTLPVAIDGARVGDSIAVTIETLEQRSAATSSGTGEGHEGRFLSDPFVAGICPTCRDAGRDFLYPETYLDGTGEQAVRCATCHSEVNPFSIGQGYTIVFDDHHGIGVTLDPAAAQKAAKNARELVGLTQFSRQHPIVALALADLVGVAARCRISMGNLGTIPAVDLPSSHNCGDFGAFLLNADHEFAVTEEELQQRTDAHMDIDSVRPGSVLVAPVKVDGAGLYAGDAHAMIGDGEIAGHAVDISARLVVRVQVLKGVALDGPVLLPPLEDLPFLARPLTDEERRIAAELAKRYDTPLEGPCLPIQVLGSGTFINEAVDNAVDRSARLLGLSPDEIRNRATISGAVEIGRLPGLVQVNMLVPKDRLAEAGLLGTVNEQYGEEG